MKHNINLQYSSKQKTGDIFMKVIRQAVSSALQSETVDIPCVINVLIGNDKVIRKYNLDYRGIDKVTDVLSFPMQIFQKAGWGGCLTPEFDEDTGELPLGDIVISMERAEEQAAEYGNTPEYETAYLIIHSTLHLLGYDHNNEINEKAMHIKCEKVMQEMGFKTDDK